MTEENTEYKCPVEGCTHEPFKTVQARTSHIRNVHPEYLEEESTESKVPIVEEHFAELLRKFRIKADLARNIANNISATGGPRAFEDPGTLLQRLALWSKEIPAHMRTNIMDQWFAEIGTEIPPEIKSLAGMSSEEIKKSEDKTKPGSGVKYVYDAEMNRVRMARENEIGGTLEEAKELKRMAESENKGPEESPFIQGEDGTWKLNPKAKITGLEFMAYQVLTKSQEKGEPTDPLTAMSQVAEMMSIIRETSGGGGSNMPSWMTDPALFINTMRELSGGGQGDSALKAQIEQMQRTIADLKDEKFQGILDTQQKQIEIIANNLNKTIESIADMKKGQVGRTEMDIIHDIAQDGLGLLKTELPGLRKDVKDAFTSTNIPERKTAEQRDTRRTQIREAIQADTEIEEIGNRLFLS